MGLAVGRLPIWRCEGATQEGCNRLLSIARPRRREFQRQCWHRQRLHTCEQAPPRRLCLAAKLREENSKMLWPLLSDRRLNGVCWTHLCLELQHLVEHLVALLDSRLHVRLMP